MEHDAKPLRNPNLCVICGLHLTRICRYNPTRQLCCGRAECRRGLEQRRQQRCRARRAAADQGDADKALKRVRDESAARAVRREINRKQERQKPLVIRTVHVTLGLAARMFGAATSADAQRVFAELADAGERLGADFFG
jgi:hypothetical protein